MMTLAEHKAYLAKTKKWGCGKVGVQPYQLAVEALEEAVGLMDKTIDHTVLDQPTLQPNPFLVRDIVAFLAKLEPK